MGTSSPKEYSRFSNIGSLSNQRYVVVDTFFSIHILILQIDMTYIDNKMQMK